MSEDLGSILETKPKLDEGINRQGEQPSSPVATLVALRFIGSASLIIGISVGLLMFGVYHNSYRGEGGYLLLYSLGAVVQGLVIFALFNALALVVENLVAIRERLSQK
jgi:hypothetical protein